MGRITSGTLRLGDSVYARVDHKRRAAIRAHHSATHLLHESLRRHLGTHVSQKGSLNAPDRLRFDISQPRPVTSEELAAVEREVNARIRENAEVTTRLMTPDEAVKLGAMALFGEKYGDEVRVVAMGESDSEKSAYSIELCGGTHVGRTGDIGLFRITGEGAVSAGIRRIEAVAGEAAIAAIAEESRILADSAAALKTPAAELPARITALQEQNRRMEKQISELQKKLAIGGAAASVEDIAGIKFSGRNVGDVSAKDLKSVATDILKSQATGIVALISTADQKASIVIGVSPDLTETFDAVTLARAAAAAVGGSGGGGSKTLAQAGGPDATKWEAALDAVRAALTNH